MSREKTTWTGSVNEPIWGSMDGEQQIVYVTLDNDPGRRVEIRISPEVMRWIGRRAPAAPCTYNAAGFGRPPEYCDEDAAPGSEYCALHQVAVGERDNIDEPQWGDE